MRDVAGARVGVSKKTKVFWFFFPKKNCFLASLSLLTIAASSDPSAPLLSALFSDPAHALDEASLLTPFTGLLHAAAVH